MAEQILPSSGADPQDYYYLNYSMPGSYSRRMYEERTCNPLWPTFGCKTDPLVIGDQFVPNQTSMPDWNPMEPTPFTKDTNPFFWDWQTIFSQMPIMNAEDNSDSMADAMDPVQAAQRLAGKAKTADFWKKGVLYTALVVGGVYFWTWNGGR